MLTNIAEVLTYRQITVRKMKAVYHTLNYFNLDISSECFIGECWIPQKRVIDVKNLLTEVN